MLLFARRFLGGLLSKAIMPAQILFPKKAPFDCRETKYWGFVETKRLISSSNRAKVALTEVRKGKKRITKNTRVILHGFGNADRLEHYDYDGYVFDSMSNLPKDSDGNPAPEFRKLYIRNASVQNDGKVEYLLRDIYGTIIEGDINLNELALSGLGEEDFDGQFGQQVLKILSKRGEIHHELYDILKRSNFSDVIVSGVNFRNVASSGESMVCSAQDWVDDVIAVVDYYRAQGIPLKHILLNGHSLSGANFTIAAAQIYLAEREKRTRMKGAPLTEEEDLDCSPRLFANRTFSTLSDEIMAILGRFFMGLIAGAMVGGLALLAVTASTAAVMGGLLFVSNLINPKIAKLIVRPVLNGILKFGFGIMDVASAYQVLPKGAKACVMAKDDGVIPECGGSLHYGLKPALKDLLGKSESAGDERLQIELKQELAALKESKFLYNQNAKLSPAAHCAPLTMLFRYQKVDKPNANAYPYEPMKVNGRFISGEDEMIAKCKKMLGL